MPGFLESIKFQKAMAIFCGGLTAALWNAAGWTAAAGHWPHAAENFALGLWAAVLFVWIRDDMRDRRRGR